MQETLQALLQQRLGDALSKLHLDHSLAIVTPVADARFGDYQTNAAMVFAKQEKKNPRLVAAELIEKIDVADLAATPEIAGPGFINFRLTTSFLEQRVTALLQDPRCGVPVVENPQTIVIDFSSPNVAKPMHVGHIKSTVLGDALARIARFLGHRVITDNHLGDWGTQFGKVIYGVKKIATTKLETVYQLVELYREVNEREQHDPVMKAAVREELVKLQQGDLENVAIWKEVVGISWKEFEQVYRLLNIVFDECLGESSYNEALAPLVKRLEQEGIAEESQGALVVFFKDHPALAEKPFLIRKADGGFLYATTDIATLEYREQRWHPDQVWYVCGMPQQLHFEQLFAVAKKMEIKADLRHVIFGSILGEDRKMMKTRSGDNVDLIALLEEAIDRAHKLVAEKNPSFSEEEKKKIAQTVGLGALKYADLMQHRTTDTIFSWEKMLSFQGNTAPYLQNAYVRIQSILRKDKEAGGGSVQGPIKLQEDAERTLALQLLQFAEMVPAVLVDARPNILCLALYELANSFHRFYEQCPILKAEESLKESRL
ncbi:MAG: arginine--tRNA ligase, partial [Verrucomicrobiota bacterium]